MLSEENHTYKQENYNNYFSEKKILYSHFFVYYFYECNILFVGNMKLFNFEYQMARTKFKKILIKVEIKYFYS